MNVLAASALVLSSLVTPGATLASDGTIFFSGEIVLSTTDPRSQAPRAPHDLAPQHTTALRPLPLVARFELLDYFADYMRERGTARSQLAVKTIAYE